MVHGVGPGCEDVDAMACRSGYGYRCLLKYIALTMRSGGEAGRGKPGMVSNRGMSIPHAIEQRLTDLEIKASYTEDLLEQLNQVVIRQQQQIDLLILELGRLRQHSLADSAPAARSLRDELPPHY